MNKWCRMVKGETQRREGGVGEIYVSQERLEEREREGKGR